MHKHMRRVRGEHERPHEAGVGWALVWFWLGFGLVLVLASVWFAGFRLVLVLAIHLTSASVREQDGSAHGRRARRGAAAARAARPLVFLRAKFARVCGDCQCYCSGKHSRVCCCCCSCSCCSSSVPLSHSRFLPPDCSRSPLHWTQGIAGMSPLR